MTPINEIKTNFTETIHTWETTVKNYDNESFNKKPAEDKWSMAQLCQHLIGATNRMFGVIEKCLTEGNNSTESKTDRGHAAISTNILSPTKVAVPAHAQTPPEAYESGEAASKIFAEFESVFMILADRIATSESNGKELHPVLGYLSAHEWLHTIEMHFRHHLKQKEEIDAFLAK